MNEFVNMKYWKTEIAIGFVWVPGAPRHAEGKCNSNFGSLTPHDV